MCGLSKQTARRVPRGVLVPKVMADSCTPLYYPDKYRSYLFVVTLCLEVRIILLEGATVVRYFIYLQILIFNMQSF